MADIPINSRGGSMKERPSTPAPRPSTPLLIEQLRRASGLKEYSDSEVVRYALFCALMMEEKKPERAKKCARPDCGQPVIRSDRRGNKIYCSLSCAHLMAVRRSRGKA